MRDADTAQVASRDREGDDVLALNIRGFDRNLWLRVRYAASTRRLNTRDLVESWARTWLTSVGEQESK